MKIVIDISKDRYDEIMAMDWKNCRRFFDEEIRAIHDGKAISQEPCDAVSREMVKVSLAFDSRTDDMLAVKMRKIFEIIDALPSVTPAEKVGHWEYIQYDGNPNIGNWHCSECRTIIPHMPEETDNTPIYKWCPMCGVKMEEVDR